MTREDRLIQQIIGGDARCWDELISLYYPAILRYCLWHMPDRESALDATQETFLKLVRSLHRYERRGQFRAFLYRIAANTCTDMLRQRAPEVLSPDGGDAASAPLADDSYLPPEYDRAEDREQLSYAFARLDGLQRELVLLRYGQELSLREIASLTGLKLRTVQTKLRRAIHIMKQVL